MLSPEEHMLPFVFPKLHLNPLLICTSVILFNCLVRLFPLRYIYGLNISLEYKRVSNVPLELCMNQ